MVCYIGLHKLKWIKKEVAMSVVKETAGVEYSRRFHSLYLPY